MTMNDILNRINNLMQDIYKACPDDVDEIPKPIITITAYLSVLYAYGSLPDNIGLDTLDYALGFYMELLLYQEFKRVGDKKSVVVAEERLLREYNRKCTEIPRIKNTLKGLGLLI